MADTKEITSSALGENEPHEHKETESSSTVTFNPPVYIQRYISISNILHDEWSQKWIRKVVDFGCAEFKFFKYIKEFTHIEHIVGVDVDEELIRKCKYEARPLNFHYVLGFPHKLTVDLFVGSIAEPDERLLDVDAVICIELIEHLYPDVLEKVPITIFEFIKPKLAIFTTPNADFNVLFDLKAFRHDDHKFEWTRKEFEDWSFKIIEKYPEYEVNFEGIGKGPDGTAPLGCCSQMAVFRQKVPNQTSKKVSANQPYKLLDSFTYPYKPDTRSADEKFSDELKYRLNTVFINRLFVDEEDDLKFEIPVDYLWDSMKDCSTTTLEVFIHSLQEKGYVVKEKNADFVLQIIQSEESDSDELSCSSLSLKNDVTTTNTNLEEERWDDF